MVGKVATLNNATVDLTGHSLASEVPCGPGFIVAVVYFKANGSYSEYLSMPVNVTCNSSIEIRFELSLSFIFFIVLLASYLNNVKEMNPCITSNARPILMISKLI